MALKIGNLTKLYLGYVGENKTRTIEIDMTTWLEKWPDAVIAVTVQRPSEDDLYIAATEVQNSILSWAIVQSDLAKAGTGIAQIRALDRESGACYLSRTVGTVVDASMHGTTDENAPEKASGWVNQVLEAAADVEDRAEELDALVDEASAAIDNADTATTNALTATQQATTATGAANTAANAANTAAGTANTAADRADAAANTANTAADAANAAAGLADTAATAANTAADAANAAASAANTAAERAEIVAGMKVEATTLDPGSEATATYADGTLRIGIPEGLQGEPGYPEVTGSFMALSTDKNGTPEWSKLLAYEADEVEILPETELVKQSANTFLLVPAISEILVPGELYTVTFNGVDYTCEVIPIPAGPHGAFALGNAAAVMGTGDTGEPFALLTSAIGAMASDYYAQVFTVEDVDAATIAVARGGIKKIDKKFLPEGAGGGSGTLMVLLTFSNEDAYTYQASHTSQEVYNAIHSGTYVSFWITFEQNGAPGYGNVIEIISTMNVMTILHNKDTGEMLYLFEDKVYTEEQAAALG